MIMHTKPNAACLPGFWEIDETPAIDAGRCVVSDITDSIKIIEDVITLDTCLTLIDMFERSKISSPVSVNGLKDEVLGIGSKRASGWSEYIASQLTQLIVPQLGALVCDPFTATDWWQDGRHAVWKPVMVSPLLRFMKYEKDSEHYAHYDAGFFYEDGRYRTLKSLVVYLTTNRIGATRFIRDGQENLPVWERKHDDWNRRAREDEVIYSSYPVQGKALVFDHRLCHDVQQFDGGEGVRIIIRGDIIYERA